jgi:hypothetical protein
MKSKNFSLLKKRYFIKKAKLKKAQKKEKIRQKQFERLRMGRKSLIFAF